MTENLTSTAQPVEETTDTAAVPPVDVAEAPSQAPPAPARRPRPRLAALVRWTAALLVFAGAAAGTAYGVTEQDRTDLPGLATEPDGRWTFPAITPAALPKGSPGPFAEANTSGAHYADLRDLLVPAPDGATDDKALPGRKGWVPTSAYVSQYMPQERDSLAQQLTDYDVRHIAARGWTMPDGTTTRVYLLQFRTDALAENLAKEGLLGSDEPQLDLVGAPRSHADDRYGKDETTEDVTATVYDEDKPYGPEHVRQAYLVGGDTVALIVQSRKGGTVAALPFAQTVALQARLLG